DLQEAMEDFAGKAGDVDPAKAKAKRDAEIKKLRDARDFRKLRADCVIVGFVPVYDGPTPEAAALAADKKSGKQFFATGSEPQPVDFSALVLATVVDGRLRVVGEVRDGLD